MEFRSIAPSRPRGKMLMVVPSNVEVADGKTILDGDFAQYVRLYLQEFESLVVACTICPAGTFPTTEALDVLTEELGERFRVILLPMPYREDRYILKRSSVRRQLKAEIEKSDFVVVAPHSAFDWPTLAAEICLEIGKPYNMEGDWNLQQVNRSNWSKMPFGIEKLRRYLWMKYHDPKYFRLMRNSTVALLHGQDVFEAYREIAPNPYMVNNIRITEKDKIDPPGLQAKIETAVAGAPLEIVYAGRAIEMKGPFEWLQTLVEIKGRGVAFRATWFGEGELAPVMRSMIRDHGLENSVTLAGKVERATVFHALFKAHIFLFCHLTRESPRNLIEALAAAAPLVGFDSPYSENITKDHGGARLVPTGDTQELANLLVSFDRDRASLAQIISDAARSGQQFDRSTAVQRRISLMKQHLLPAG